MQLENIEKFIHFNKTKNLLNTDKTFSKWLLSAFRVQKELGPQDLMVLKETQVLQDCLALEGSKGQLEIQAVLVTQAPLDQKAPLEMLALLGPQEKLEIQVMEKYHISLNNSWERLFFFSHQKGAIIRGKAIIRGGRLFQIFLTGGPTLNILFYYTIKSKKLITSNIT